MDLKTFQRKMLQYTMDNFDVNKETAKTIDIVVIVVTFILSPVAGIILLAVAYYYFTDSKNDSTESGVESTEVVINKTRDEVVINGTRGEQPIINGKRTKI